MKLGILTTHPIQYQVPWFRLLDQVPDLDLTVYFCFIPDVKQQGEGFGTAFQWDIPLLDGYKYEVLDNLAEYPTPSRFGGCDTPGLDRILHDGDFDAFIVNGWVVKSCIQLLWACRKHGVPCIVRGTSNHLRRRKAWKRLLHRLLLSQYSALLYIGEGNRRFYRGNGVAAEKLFFTPYCVENQRFTEAEAAFVAQRLAIRREWGIPDNAVAFMFCGKFISKKRPMDALQALDVISKQTDVSESVHLLMVGSGELFDSCKKLVRDRGLPVTFAGFLNQSEMARAYVAADCQVLPSDNGETWGLVINEGMACGLPAIVSDQVGCHLDLVTRDETGAVYPTGDVEALASCMGEFAVDKARLQWMGHKARERVAMYNHEMVVRGTLSALAYLGLRY